MSTHSNRARKLNRRALPLCVRKRSTSCWRAARFSEAYSMNAIFLNSRIPTFPANAARANVATRGRKWRRRGPARNLKERM